ncbi:proprotein convertase subtilisin/kexin type 5-like [Patella vulgata]|uniref:proprotein convertase subtilisin/kexin type 5-like n=1 Tax=Patella vulgata TaxID=6465 RepID=UPI0024A8E90D|nr:proprotein convertase subtilisin/kexin type 5-like [Patella vulgata]
MLMDKMLTIDRVLSCLLIFSYVYFVLGSLNVALNKPTWQTSTYDGAVSTRAVDGNMNQVWTGRSCAATTNKGESEWFCVDLKQSFDISSIKIFNVLDGGRVHIKGFEIRLSSTGLCDEAGFTSATPCYKDHTSIAQYVYTIERCNQASVPSLSARFVFVSVKRAHMLICELQIFTESCPDGFYGTNCNLRCPANCADNVCGKMIGSCSNGCQGDLYGNRCELSCSTRCKNGKCNARTGKCIGCKDGYYSDVCEESCSTCNGPCRQLDGVCLTGCKDGYWGCNGLCLQTCSYCNTGGCRIEDGVCHNGCQVGFNNPKCFNNTS